MATGLIENYNSREIERANILTNRNILKVLVEDESDIPFWADVLQYSIDTELTGRFSKRLEFATFHTNNHSQNFEEGTERQVSKGKKHLLKLHRQLGNFLILCLDSDYDYLLDDSLMNSHTYILQTYTYSIENYLCQASTLEELCKESSQTSPIPFNFPAFFIQFSETIYPLLVWSLWLEQKEAGTKPRTLPRKTASNLMTTNGSVVKQGEKSIISTIKKKIEAKIELLEKCFPQDTTKVQELKNTLESKLLIKENAYLFMRGHNLFDFVLESLIKPVSQKKNPQQVLYLNFRYKQETDAILYHNLLKPAINKLLSQVT